MLNGTSDYSCQIVCWTLKCSNSVYVILNELWNDDVALFISIEIYASAWVNSEFLVILSHITLLIHARLLCSTSYYYYMPFVMRILKPVPYKPWLSCQLSLSAALKEHRLYCCISRLLPFSSFPLPSLIHPSVHPLSSPLLSSSHTHTAYRFLHRLLRHNDQRFPGGGDPSSGRRGWKRNRTKKSSGRQCHHPDIFHGSTQSQPEPGQQQQRCRPEPHILRGSEHLLPGAEHPDADL